jgi:hypothetical protein
MLYRTRAYMELFEQPLKCMSIMLDNVDPMADNRILLDFFKKDFVQHCFTFTVSESPETEHRTVATFALAVRRSNHSIRSHPLFFSEIYTFTMIPCFPQPNLFDMIVL